VVSRDRSHVCREGIAAGAPQATQIADRWHLLRNLAEKLDEFLGQKRSILEAAVRPPTQPETEGDEDSLPEGSVENLYEDPGAPGPLTPDRPRPGYAHRQQVSRKHYELVVERWQEIRRLHKAGADVTDIARKLGTSRPEATGLWQGEHRPTESEGNGCLRKASRRSHAHEILFHLKIGRAVGLTNSAFSWKSPGPIRWAWGTGAERWSIRGCAAGGEPAMAAARRDPLARRGFLRVLRRSEPHLDDPIHRSA
jgi:hypothetical protein